MFILLICIYIVYRYSRQAKVTSTRFKDRPLPPLDLAKYWVEYIARHKGAPHLRSAGQELPFIMYHNVDAFVFIVATIGFVLYFIVWVVQRLLEMAGIRLFKKNQMSNISVKKKKN